MAIKGISGLPPSGPDEFGTFHKGPWWDRMSTGIEASHQLADDATPNTPPVPEGISPFLGNVYEIPEDDDE